MTSKPTKTRLTFPQALRVIRSLKTSQRILGLLRTQGFEPVSWGSRSSLAALSHSLSTTEDWLEMNPGKLRDQERVIIRELRRRVEAENT